MKKSSKILPAAVCLALLTLTACTMTSQPIGNPEAPYPPATQLAVGDIYHLPTGVKVSAEQMNAAITDTRIIYVGETHDNPASHRLELQVLEAVAKRYPGQLSIGIEMFNPTQQDGLDRWVAGDLDEKSFLKDVDWFGNWKMDFAYYADILHFARDNRIPVIGLNATREMVKTVGRNSLEELDVETRARLPEFDLDDPYQKAMTTSIYREHGPGQSMLDGFLRIQTLWDETMAESIVAHMRSQQPDHRMVVMAGGNHVRYGFGIPRRVYRRMPTSYVLVGSRELVVPKAKQGQIMDVDLPHFPMVPYDYMAYTEYESLPGERVKLGVRFKEADGRIQVEAVVPGSAADQAGIEAGDFIEFLDDKPINDSFDLVYEISKRQRDDEADMIIDRNGKPASLKVIFTPLPPMADHGQGVHKK